MRRKRPERREGAVCRGRPRVGISYSDYVRPLLLDRPDLFDYVEIPFELLRANPHVVPIENCPQVLLHSASLSMAGDVPPDEATWSAVGDWIGRTSTPWLSEHLAFFTAHRTPDDGSEHSAVPIYDIGYAISAPMNEESLDVVVAAVDACSQRFGIPILLENSPLYFTPPGSTMTQFEYIRRLCERSPARLLLDVTHLVITAQNLGRDPIEALHELPLDRILEVHVAGISDFEGTQWDDHTVRAPEVVMDVLRVLARGSGLEAVTLEYNWSVTFPRRLLLNELARVQEALAA